LSPKRSRPSFNQAWIGLTVDWAAVLPFSTRIRFLVEGHLASIPERMPRHSHMPAKGANRANAWKEEIESQCRNLTIVS
jgi:hypothetical protein